MPRPDRRRPDLDEPDDTPIRRRTHRSPRSGFWNPVSISLIGGGLIVVVLAIALMVLKRSTGEGVGSALVAGPRAEVEGSQWDCHQLVEYLNSRGLMVSAEPDDLAQVVNRFNPKPAGEIRQGMGTSMILTSAKHNGLLLCMRVGAHSVEVLFDNHHSPDYRQMGWGDFWFEATEGSDDLADAIRKALAGCRSRGRSGR